MNDSDDVIDDAAIAMEEANDAEKGGKKGKKAKKTGAKGKTRYLFYFSVLSFLTPLPLAVERHWLIVNVKTKLRLPRALLLVSSRMYSNFSSFILFFYFKNYN